DLWKLRAEFSRVSSSLLSGCDSVSSSLRLRAPPLPPLPPPLSSTLLLPHPSSSPSPPLISSSTLGSFSLGELEDREEVKEEQRRSEELKLLHESAVSQLTRRIAELSVCLQAEEAQREEREKEVQSFTQAVVKLSRVLSSSSVCVSTDVSSLLSVLLLTESAMQRTNQELQ
ncbi:ensconsin-like, partial [Notothenia coriiceps]|uniref:Ensconsin-like n=1 Tax=Notothenia coriiceps TaxID=8208 RepID=A0A6I9NL16_9TELE